MNEHWRIKNNSFGLFAVNHKASGWDKLDQIIDNYYKVHRLELKEIEKENKTTLATRKNKFGSASKIRMVASIPVGLMRILEKCEPDLFKDKKKFHVFIKRYKKFKVCQEI